MYKVNKFMERFWLIMAIVFALWVTYMYFTEKDEDGILLYYIAVPICLAFYFVRRMMRIKMEKYIAEEKAAKKSGKKNPNKKK